MTYILNYLIINYCKVISFKMIKNMFNKIIIKRSTLKKIKKTIKCKKNRILISLQPKNSLIIAFKISWGKKVMPN